MPIRSKLMSIYLAIEDIDHSRTKMEPADQRYLRALPQDRAQ